MRKAKLVSPSPPQQGEQDGSQCSVCDGAARGSGHVGAACRLVHVDDELIVLVDPDRPGVLVAPRSHVAGLPVEPSHAGPVLAGLRDVAMAVQQCYRTTDSLVEPVPELPGASGHVCFQVAPMAAEGGSVSKADPQLLADAVATALGGPSRTKLPMG